MEQLVIIGASGHGRVILDMARRTKRFDKITFYDDHKKGEIIDSILVEGTIEEALNSINDAKYIIAIGDNKVRNDLYTLFNANKAIFTSVIDPDAVISKSSLVGLNCAIMMGVVINNGTVIGNSCIINTSASIDHDCIIKDNTHISVGVHLAGSVEVGKNVMIGIGSSVSNNVRIASDVIIGAGGVVVRDILKEGTYVGVPVRRIK